LGTLLYKDYLVCVYAVCADKLNCILMKCVLCGIRLCKAGLSLEDALLIKVLVV